MIRMIVMKRRMMTMARVKSMETYDNEIKKVQDQIITTQEKLKKLEDQLQKLVDNRKDYQADIIKTEFMQGKRSFEETMVFLKCPGNKS